jgi:hypothetical protein
MVARPRDLVGNLRHPTPLSQWDNDPSPLDIFLRDWDHRRRRPTARGPRYEEDTECLRQPQRKAVVITAPL